MRFAQRTRTLPPFTEFMPVRCQVNLAAVSGVRDEDVVNTFAFAVAESSGTLLTPLSVIASQLETFYDSIGDRIQATVSRGGTTVKMYDLRQARPQVPVYDAALGFGTAAGTGESMPSEVALCVSFQGAREAGKPQRRRRGRVYIGPIINSGTSTHTRPDSVILADVLAAAQVLIDASQASATWKWCVFSPTTAGGFYLPGGSGPPFFGGDAFVTITDGWVDNAWDTQRRRGIKPTTRSTFA